MKKLNTFPGIALFLSVLIVFLLSYPEQGFADGCFFYHTEKLGNSAESPNQRALIIHDGEKETLILQVKYSGTVDNFSWTVPLPSLPEQGAITVVNDSIFQQLHNQTQPWLMTYDSDGDQRAGKGWENGSDVPPESEVQIWERLQVGPYEIAVLSSSSSQALIDWLSSNGYNFPAEAQSIVDFYIQKSWYFVAMRVQIETQLSKGNSTYQAGLPAIKMIFKTEKPVFPLRISELTSANENEIELYVATNHRMICDGYQTAIMEYDELQRLAEQNLADNSSSNKGFTCDCSLLFKPEPEPEIDYEEIFRDKLASYNTPTFIVEYAGEGYTSNDPVQYPHVGSFDGYFNEYFAPDTYFWLTRFRTILPPISMQEDVSFVPDPDGDKWLRLYIVIDEEYFSWATIFSIPGLFILPLLLSKKIRKRYGKNLLIAVLLTMIAFA